MIDYGSASEDEMGSSYSNVGEYSDSEGILDVGNLSGAR